jgi:hypothetical protein
LALAIVAAFALGGITPIVERKRQRWFLLAGTGVASSLGMLIHTLQDVLHSPANASGASTTMSGTILIEFMISGVLVAALGGLLGGWLRLKALGWVGRLIS